MNSWGKTIVLCLTIVFSAAAISSALLKPAPLSQSDLRDLGASIARLDVAITSGPSEQSFRALVSEVEVQSDVEGANLTSEQRKAVSYLVRGATEADAYWSVAIGNGIPASAYSGLVDLQALTPAAAKAMQAEEVNVDVADIKKPSLNNEAHQERDRFRKSAIGSALAAVSTRAKAALRTLAHPR
jgi:hypothetical protein